MTNKIILSTIVDEGIATDLWSNTKPRFRDSSPWLRVNLSGDLVQMPINTVLDMDIEGFVIHQIGTNNNVEWWSGFYQTAYSDGNIHLNVVEMLPAKLMKRLRDKSAMIHYDQSLEAFPLVAKSINLYEPVTTSINLYEHFYSNFKKFDLPPEQFIYTTCNLLEEEVHVTWCTENNIPENNRMIIIASNFFAAATQTPGFFGSDNDTITVAEHLAYKQNNDITLYNCLNRIIRGHRVALSAMLNYYNLIDGYKISHDKYPNHWSTNVNASGFIDHLAFQSENITDIYKKLPLVLDTDQFQINKAQHFFKELYLQTYINVITETFCTEYNGESMFFSEKIFKPMRARQPFIIVGAPGSIKALQDQGFKTFDRWFDESYSDIKDNTLRIETICKLLLELNNKTKTEWIEMYTEMEDVLNHNYDVLMQTHWTGKLRAILNDRIPHGL